MNKCFQQNETYGSFFINGYEMAISVSYLSEVLSYPSNLKPVAVHHFSGKLPFEAKLLGVFNLRGMVLPLLEISRLHAGDSSNSQLSEDKKVVIVRVQDSFFALAIDRLGQILRPAQQDIKKYQYSKNMNENSMMIRQPFSGVVKNGHQDNLIQIFDPQYLLENINIPLVKNDQIHANMELSKNIKNNLVKVITFGVGAQNLAFQIKDISEIIRLPDVLQNSMSRNGNYLGVIQLRDKQLPVMDLGKTLKIPNKESSNHVESQRIVIIQVENGEVGLLVDRVFSIDQYSGEQLMPMADCSHGDMNVISMALKKEGQPEVFLIDIDKFRKCSEIQHVVSGHESLYKSQSEHKKNKKTGVCSSYLSFTAFHQFGVPLQMVREIISGQQNLSALPGVPDFVIGAVNLRNKMVTVLDPKKLYLLQHQSNLDDSKKRILVFENANGLYGVLVDSVDGILKTATEEKLELPEIFLKQAQGQFHADVKEAVRIGSDSQGGGSLIVLDVDKLLEHFRQSAA